MASSALERLAMKALRKGNVAQAKAILGTKTRTRKKRTKRKAATRRRKKSRRGGRT